VTCISSLALVWARRQSRTATIFFFALAVALGWPLLRMSNFSGKEKARPEGRALFLCYKFYLTFLL
jgi:hypothetical protein